jgi:hypothetical protein
MQQALKATAGAARTRIAPAELLDELLVPVDNALAALDARLATGTPVDACSSVRRA